MDRTVDFDTPPAAGTVVSVDGTDGEAPTLDDVKEALKGLNEVKGTPACLKVLALVNATNVSAILPDKYGPFIESCISEAQ